MRLHHQPRSRSTRVLWLLEELDIPFDLTVMSREEKQTPYLALHPLGRSPVLEEEGGPVFESAALILHLADQNPDAGLIAPLGSHERALQYQWCFFGMTDMEGALVDIARQLWKSSGDPDATIVENASARFVKTAGVIENVLGNADYLVGNTFSVADIVVGSVLGFARTGEITELPTSVVPYVDRLEARPARQRAVAASA
jgi:glutathione S-transferase